MSALPIDERGYPVPWFVAWVNGKPDHRIASGEKRTTAMALKLCWFCGQLLGRYGAFVIGPMCSINRVSSDPAMHRDCALFAVSACPFLTRPKARRRTADLPDDVRHDGVMIERNPGVSMLWVSSRWSFFSDHQGGVLIHIGEKPEEVMWFAEGRRATRDEVLASFETGCPTLETMARMEGALPEYEARKAQALKLVPAQEGARP